METDTAGAVAENDEHSANHPEDTGEMEAKLADSGDGEYPATDEEIHLAKQLARGDDTSESSKLGFNHSQSAVDGANAESIMASIGEKFMAGDSNLAKQYAEYMASYKEANSNSSSRDEGQLISQDKLDGNSDLSKQYEEYLMSREQFNKTLEQSDMYEKYLAMQGQLSKNKDLSKGNEDHLMSRDEVVKNSDISKQYEEYMKSQQQSAEHSELSKDYEEVLVGRDESGNNSDLQKQYEEYLKSQGNSGKDSEVSKDYEEVLVSSGEVGNNSDLQKQYEEYLKSQGNSGKDSEVSKDCEENIISPNEVGQNAALQNQYEEYLKSKEQSVEEEVSVNREKADKNQDLQKEYEEYLASREQLYKNLDLSKHYEEYTGDKKSAAGSESNNPKDQISNEGSLSQQAPKEDTLIPKDGGVNETSGSNKDTIDQEQANLSLARQYEEYLAKSNETSPSKSDLKVQFKDKRGQDSSTGKKKRGKRKKVEDDTEDSLHEANAGVDNSVKELLRKRLKFEDTAEGGNELSSGNPGTADRTKSLHNVISSLTKIKESVPNIIPNAERNEDGEYILKEPDTTSKKTPRRGRKPSVKVIVKTDPNASPLVKVDHGEVKQEREDGLKKMQDLAEKERKALLEMKKEAKEAPKTVPDVTKAMSEVSKAMAGIKNLPLDFQQGVFTAMQQAGAGMAAQQSLFNNTIIQQAQSGSGSQILTPMEIYSNLLIQMEATGELTDPPLGADEKQEDPKPDKPRPPVEKVKRFACSECNKEYATSSSLRKHMYSHMEEKPHKCKYCNKGFTESSSLKSHEYIHTGEKPLKCHFCDQGFRSPSNLRRHFRVHTGEKPFKCEVCGKEFSQTVRLQSHMLLHTGETPYKCKYCSKGFRTPNQLNSHHRTHTGERPFKCNMCDKTFSDSSNLRTHVRRHIGDKPHECEVCHVLFGFISDLKRHMLTHTKKKPFVCPHCNKGFTQSYTLNAHVAIHTGEGLHRCPVCLKNFTTGTNLRRHLLKHPEYLEDHPEIAADVHSSTAGGTRNSVSRINEPGSDDEDKDPENGIIISELQPDNANSEDTIMSKLVESVLSESASAEADSLNSLSTSLGTGDGPGSMVSGLERVAGIEASDVGGLGVGVGENMAEFQTMINKLLGQHVFSGMMGGVGGVPQAGNQDQDLATIAEVLQDASEAGALPGPSYSGTGTGREPVTQQQDLPVFPNFNS